MRCSIERRKSGKWSVRYSFLGGDGRRHFRRLTLSGGTRKDAEALAARVASEISRGTYADAGHLTVGELCDEWLSATLPRVAPTTGTRYRGIIDVHIKPVLGAIRVRELTRRQVSQAMLEWQTKPRHDKRSGVLSDTSVRHNLTTLSTLLHYGVQSGYLTVNPCANVKAPARSTQEVKPLTVEAMRRLIDKADPDMAAALLTTSGTGLRRGELLGLRWGDLSLDNALLHVRQTVTISRTGIVTKRPKTRKSIRTLGLPPFVVAALDMHAKRQAERYAALDIALTPETPVFDWLGELWHPTNFSSMFYRLRRRAGVACRFHDLRHAFASILLQQHVNLKIASHLLGHASITITSDTYSHVIQEQAHEAAAAIQLALGCLSESEHFKC